MIRWVRSKRKWLNELEINGNNKFILNTKNANAFHKRNGGKMKIYNTLTQRKDEFIPIEEGKVKMYVCGPTVYNYIHIGNARPAIIFDTLRRYFEYIGYDVNYVTNFTDVDDKIIKKANEEGVSASEISERYIEEFRKDMDALNVKVATCHPKATEEIEGMIEMIDESL